MRNISNSKNRKAGQAILVVVILCTSVFLTVVLGIVNPITNEIRLTENLAGSKASLYSADSGSEDAIIRVKRNMITNYADPIILDLNGIKVTTMVTDASGEKTILSTGNINGNYRKVSAKIVTGVGVDFYYGIFAGVEGFSLSGGGVINGSVYSNGPIQADSGVTITGSAIAANVSSTSFSSIGGSNYNSLFVGTDGVGEVWAHQVMGVTASGQLYCKTGTKNNKTCDTSRDDPVAESYAIEDSDIDAWKAEATAGGVYNGNFSVGKSGATIGPKKINGNLSVAAGGVLTLTGTVWVTGTITFTGGSDLVLSPGYGYGGGVLLADGEVSVSGGSSFTGSGSPGSYPMIITTSNSTSALTASGSVGAVVLVAQNGSLRISGGTSARSVSAKKIVVTGGGVINYDSGLSNYHFSNGPAGGWNIDSWREVQ